MQKSKYQFNYAVAGDARQPVLIMLHGFLGSLADWQQIMDWLSNDYYCLAIDLPGHGRTQNRDHDSLYTFPGCAAAIVNLLDELKITRANLLGYSMGGRLALYLVVHYPERWVGLIIESASPGLPEGVEKKQRWQEDQKRAARLDQGEIQQFIRDWYEQPIFASLRRHPQFQELQRQRLKNDPVELARSLRGMSAGKQESLWNKISRTRLPVMMMVGEYDSKYKKIGMEMKKRGPLLELKVIDKCGHLIHFENPQLFTQHVRQFLHTCGRQH